MPPSRNPRKPILGPSAFLGSAQGRSATTPPRRGSPELSYFQRMAEAGVPLRLRLRDGSEVVGTLEWHERGAFRVNTEGGVHWVVPRTALAWVERAATAEAAT